MSNFFSYVNDDLLENILSRLPAKAFAYAACVNKGWNNVCGQILNLPKLASALSLNPSLEAAVKEVLDEVLSEPIRPDFAIAFVGSQSSLEQTHNLITREIGSNVPVITNAGSGVIGIEALTKKLKEVKLVESTVLIPGRPNQIDNLNRGISLVIGFVPGLKSEVVPLVHRRKKKESLDTLIARFTTDVRNYTMSVSGDNEPPAIVFFGDHRIDLRQVIAEIDYAMSEETVVVGDAGGLFLWRGGEDFRAPDRLHYVVDAVGLVFAREAQTSPQGTIGFHVARSTGIVPFGPRLEVVCVGVKGRGEFSWLVTRLEGTQEILDGWTLLQDIHTEIEDEFHHLYIGVTKRRRRSFGLQNAGSDTYVVFYEVVGSEQEGFVVTGTGISPGDSFVFFHSDSATSRTTSSGAIEEFAELKSSLVEGITNPRSRRDAGVFGGLVFAASGRGESFFLQPNMDSFPILHNFPKAPVAGMFGFREIGRPIMRQEDDPYEDSGHCCMEINSAIYMVLSYTPP